MIRDLSLEGVGFNSAKRFTVGACHWLVVSHGLQRLSTRLRIASCKQINGLYEIGGEFF